MRVKCTTLFDITRTDLSSRRGNLGDVLPPELVKQRSQQGNLETILQIISLRCQPEEISTPVQGKFEYVWGKSYGGGRIIAWQFTFEVVQSSVFLHDGDVLGALKIDCAGVPMITGLDESVSLTKTLDLGPEYKNIEFEV